MSPSLLRPSAALVLAISGCASKPPLAVQRFTLTVPDSPIPEPGPAARLFALPPVRVNPVYLDPALVYRVGGGRVETDPYASLAAAPRFLMTSAIRAYLLRQPGVKNVVQGFVGPEGLTVDVLAQEMAGDFSHPGEPAGVLSLEVTFYRGARSRGRPRSSGRSTRGANRSPALARGRRGSLGPRPPVDHGGARRRPRGASRERLKPRERTAGPAVARTGTGLAPAQWQ